MLRQLLVKLIFGPGARVVVEHPVCERCGCVQDSWAPFNDTYAIPGNWMTAYAHARLCTDCFNVVSKRWAPRNLFGFYPTI